jgi:hypothetical protein
MMKYSIASIGGRFNAARMLAPKERRVRRGT